MDKVYDYGAAAATTGASAFLLAKVLGGQSSSNAISGGMSIATTVGLAAAAGSVISKLSHDYVLPHIPQPEKWATIEAGALNVVASGGGAIGAVYLMDPAEARADALPIAFYAVAGEMLGGYIHQNFIAPMIPHPKL